jgi:hypothetical protein
VLSNGSLPHNSCFALHRNQTGATHEPRFPSSASDRAPARTQIPCLICQRLLGCLSLQPSTDTSLRCFTAPSRRQSGTSYPTPLVPDPSAPAQTDSKYIAFHEGGFLQVAVSEAPLQNHAAAPCCVAGAPDTALRLLRTYMPSAVLICRGDSALRCSLDEFAFVERERTGLR